MWPTESLASVLARLQAGDETAAVLIFEHFSERLLHIARKRIGTDLRSKLDPDDVVQGAFLRFFRQHAAGECERLTCWQEVERLLAVLCRNECVNQTKQFRTASRDVRREVGPPDGVGRRPVVDGRPTPAEALVRADTLAHVRRQFRGRHRQMLDCWLDGEEIPVIGGVFTCSARTVYRVIEQAQDYVRQL